MVVVAPPITEDVELDSFNQQVSDALNTGLLAGGLVSAPVTRVVGAATVIQTVNANVQDGLNTATVTIYQRTSLDDATGQIIVPAGINGTLLRYSYPNVSLASADQQGNFLNPGPWEATNLSAGWSFNIPNRDPVLNDDYLWVQTVNIVDRDPFDDISPGSWTAPRLVTQPGLGALRAVVDYTAIRDAADESYAASITHIYLGERDVTHLIVPEQICWLIAEETTGRFAVDFQGFANEAQLNIALVNNLYSDRNFFSANEGPLTVGVDAQNDPITLAFGPRRVGFATTFTANEIFAENNQGAGATFDLVSRDIEPRLDIGAIVNI